MHGACDIKKEDNMIIVTLHGAFNAYAAEKCTRELKDAIELLSGQDFVMLVDIFDYSGATPDALAVVDIFNQWLSEKGLLAKAYVTKSPVILDILLINTPSASRILTARFSEHRHAKEWLSSIIKC